MAWERDSPMTLDLRKAAQAVIDGYEDLGLVHKVDYEGLTEAVYALRDALGKTRGAPRYMCHAGVMVPDTEGQWVHVKDLRVNGWKLDPAIPTRTVPEWE
jgi:hypothetical protein